MKALSVWQPWALLLAIGAKRYETRSWYPNRGVVGTRIAIHAGRSTEGMEILMTDQRFSRAVWELLTAAHQPKDCFAFGAIIATAVVVDAIRTPVLESEEPGPHERDLGDWSDGRWCWQLDRVHHLATPIPCRGAQGLFDLPADIDARIPRHPGDQPCSA